MPSINSPKDLIINKWRPWPVTHLDHWLASRQIKKVDYRIVLESRGFSPEKANERAKEVLANPEAFLIRGGE